MKSKDKMTIVAVVIFSAIVSIVLSNILMNKEKNKNQSIEIVTPISAELQRPPAEYYNANSINPTQTIQIGGNNTSQPFGSQ